jgi:hypothetical protein
MSFRAKGRIYSFQIPRPFAPLRVTDKEGFTIASGKPSVSGKKIRESIG